jgi:hypothetical protein
LRQYRSSTSIASISETFSGVSPAGWGYIRTKVSVALAIREIISAAIHAPSSCPRSGSATNTVSRIKTLLKGSSNWCWTGYATNRPSKSPAKFSASDDSESSMTGIDSSPNRIVRKST